MKERLERDRGNVLNAPKHRTYPPVVSFRGKKRAVVIEDSDELEELDQLAEIPARKRVRGDNGKSTEARPGPVTRSAKNTQETKAAKPKAHRKMHRARLTMRRRRVNAVPKALNRTRAQQQKRAQIHEEPLPEEHVPRQTRAQARALQSSTSSTSSLTPLPSDPARKTRSSTAKSTTSTSSSGASLSQPSSLPNNSTVKRNFEKKVSSRQRQPLKAITNGMFLYWKGGVREAAMSSV
jgi:hypothetical protein